MIGGFNFENSYLNLPQVLFTLVKPNQVKAPEMVILNKDLVDELGLTLDELMSEDGIAVLGGNKPIEGALAMAYAGHQFGHFTMLGDGRALLLGEHLTPLGQRLDIQLKGSGPTPYSRSGDGRAALGPMLREYIISEAMAGLGIATTRSLAVVVTGEPVYREQVLKGAVLTRVAKSHIRVGTFQYLAKWGNVDQLRALADYTIARHFPECQTAEMPYLAFLKAVISKQAALVAKWQHVGFIHGVMNTDNMAISGETIDYGPCAFMDQYDPKTVFSSIDRQGRYAYGNQPSIAAWNLARLAETLLSLIHPDQDQALALAQSAISAFEREYNTYWLSGMSAKLGFYNTLEEDEVLIHQLLKLMEDAKADYTNTFRDLTLGQLSHQTWYETLAFKTWYQLWQLRLENQNASQNEVEVLMRSSNPGIIPRNHLVEAAIEAAEEKGDLSFMETLLESLKNPYSYSEGQDVFAVLPSHLNKPYRTFCGT